MLYSTSISTGTVSEFAAFLFQLFELTNVRLNNILADICVSVFILDNEHVEAHFQQFLIIGTHFSHFIGAFFII